MTNQVTIQVQGMTCGGCVKSVENSVSALSGVEKVNVQLETGKVNIEFNDSKTDIKQITDTIEGKGYTVVA
ncbi:copper ion binding protein [Psychrobacillus sp. BL-248-WT-3]|uniref:copper ion binding protein n=1 Tax=Psychrobacillus sp. BL-248-WT-3 TaxID=2725306 RepID=UPI00146ED0A3|nr:copper ion binding protein [Psychrobacillus sp. BL-248-WT-3]NME06880.1 heavy-metal-associated domain-containing protein [Psychrobacillus sp. BL-248-WT-3]